MREIHFVFVGSVSSHVGSESVTRIHEIGDLFLSRQGPFILKTPSLTIHDVHQDRRLLVVSIWDPLEISVEETQVLSERHPQYLALVISEMGPEGACIEIVIRGWHQHLGGIRCSHRREEFCGAARKAVKPATDVEDGNARRHGARYKSAGAHIVHRVAEWAFYIGEVDLRSPFHVVVVSLVMIQRCLVVEVFARIAVSILRWKTVIEKIATAILVYWNLVGPFTITVFINRWLGRTNAAFREIAVVQDHVHIAAEHLEEPLEEHAAGGYFTREAVERNDTWSNALQCCWAT